MASMATARIEQFDACDDLIATAPAGANIEPLTMSLTLSIKRCSLDCKGVALIAERIKESMFSEDAWK